MHFSHRLFLNNLYKDEYATDKAKPRRDKSWQHTQSFETAKYFLWRKMKQKCSIQQFFFLLCLLVWLFHNIVCVVMIHHDPTWLCPWHTRLYINNLGKVYGKNALDFHFWKPDHVTFLTSVLSSIEGLPMVHWCWMNTLLKILMQFCSKADLKHPQAPPWHRPWIKRLLL